MLLGAALVASGFVNYVYYVFMPDWFSQKETFFELITSFIALGLMTYGLYVVRESQRYLREKATLRTLLGGFLSSLWLALYLILILG